MKTKLEIYAFTNFGSLKAFSDAIGISYVSLWNWNRKRRRISRRNAEYIETFTNKQLTIDYLRNELC